MHDNKLFSSWPSISIRICDISHSATFEIIVEKLNYRSILEAFELSAKLKFTSHLIREMMRHELANQKTITKTK